MTGKNECALSGLPPSEELSHHICTPCFDNLLHIFFPSSASHTRESKLLVSRPTTGAAREALTPAICELQTEKQKRGSQARGEPVREAWAGREAARKSRGCGRRATVRETVCGKDSSAYSSAYSFAATATVTASGPGCGGAWPRAGQKRRWGVPPRYPSSLPFSLSPGGGVKPWAKYQGVAPVVSHAEASCSVHKRAGCNTGFLLVWLFG
jgi:hypothetical protein